MFKAYFYFGCLDDGIDTRIHGLKIASTREAEMGLSVDIFTQKDKIFRYPALELYNKRALYRRAQVLQRYGFSVAIMTIAVSESRQLSPLEAGEDNSKLEPKYF